MLLFRTHEPNRKDTRALLRCLYSDDPDGGGSDPLMAAPAGEPGNSRLEVAVLERDRPRRSFRRLTQEEVESRAGEPAP